MVLHIRKIKLSDVGPFSNLSLEFVDRPGMNLICGDNGIGKTTIMESIAANFSFGDNDKISSRQPASHPGRIHVSYKSGGQNLEKEVELGLFKPGLVQSQYGDFDASRHFINVRANRSFYYQIHHAISRDPAMEQYQYGERVRAGLDPNEIKAWFSNRYLLRHHADEAGWSIQMRENLESAIRYFSILDPNVTLKGVDLRSFDIIVQTPSGEIPYEYLSSGFRSGYILLLGILKEIEFKTPNVAASKFSGVILIDEIDLHLHPVWQRDIASHLKRAFPSAQIIATTHSPHVIQAAQAEEVIALYRDEDGSVRRKELVSGKYGYAGWSIEEILEEIMGVSDTKTTLFRRAMREFDFAIDTEDPDAIMMALTELREMLHPASPLRKLLEIQAAPYTPEAPRIGAVF